MTPLRALVLSVRERVVLTTDPDWFGIGEVVAVLNYGYLITVRWANGRTSTHRADDISRAP